MSGFDTITGWAGQEHHILAIIRIKDVTESYFTLLLNVLALFKANRLSDIAC
jgi:hypothetical protein